MNPVDFKTIPLPLDPFLQRKIEIIALGEKKDFANTMLFLVRKVLTPETKKKPRCQR